MRSGVGTTCVASACPRVAESRSATGSLWTVLFFRLADYAELTRPRIALMALLTVTVGYVLGGSGSWRLFPLLQTFLGVGLVAAASSAFNQLLEQQTDACMKRTADRPLPTERLSRREVFWFGLICGLAGSGYLWLTVNEITALLTTLTLLIYVGVYTPLKRRSSFCTTIGALAGALPPVLGWTAAGGTIDSGAFALFAILFLWQFPHFLAIAWLYRHDYQQAGLRMLPTCSSSVSLTGLIAVGYALALIPVSLLPSELSSGEALAGGSYSIAALLLGVGYVFSAARFALQESTTTARSLLWFSLIYLPLLLSFLTYDHFQLLK